MVVEYYVAFLFIIVISTALEKEVMAALSVFKDGLSLAEEKYIMEVSEMVKLLLSKEKEVSDLQKKIAMAKERIAMLTEGVK